MRETALLGEPIARWAILPRTFVLPQVAHNMAHTHTHARHVRRCGVPWPVTNTPAPQRATPYCRTLRYLRGNATLSSRDHAPHAPPTLRYLRAKIGAAADFAHTSRKEVATRGARQGRGKPVGTPCAKQSALAHYALGGLRPVAVPMSVCERRRTENEELQLRSLEAQLQLLSKLSVQIQAVREEVPPRRA